MRVLAYLGCQQRVAKNGRVRIPHSPPTFYLYRRRLSNSTLKPFARYCLRRKTYFSKPPSHVPKQPSHHSLVEFLSVILLQSNSILLNSLGLQHVIDSSAK